MPLRSNEKGSWHSHQTDDGDWCKERHAAGVAQPGNVGMPGRLTMTIARYKRTRFWAVYDASGTLICVCVCRKGAAEVARRLAQVQPSHPTLAGPGGTTPGQRTRLPRQ